NRTFYTGTAYLAASVGRRAVGLFSAVKSFEPNDTLKLKVNRVLNSSGHLGRVRGNQIGIGGLIYAMAPNGIVAATNRDDVCKSVAAGLGTGSVSTISIN
ncbi:Mitochondrial import inner membrane translocase subunit TIM23-2, partial [Linum grandiflorum]